MNKPTLTEGMKEALDGLSKEAQQSEDFGEAKSILDLQLPEPNDPRVLIKDRFLYRGGGALLIGPTGIGKSSLTLQMAIEWGLGRPCFDIRPSRNLSTLICPEKK